MNRGFLRGISEFLDELSRSGMRLSIIALNLAKIALIVVGVYLLMRFGMGVFDFMARLYHTLPQWQR